MEFPRQDEVVGLRGARGRRAGRRLGCSRSDRARREAGCRGRPVEVRPSLGRYVFTSVDLRRDRGAPSRGSGARSRSPTPCPACCRRAEDCGRASTTAGRYDVGQKLDYLRATVELALERDDLERGVPGIPGRDVLGPGVASTADRGESPWSDSDWRTALNLRPTIALDRCSSKGAAAICAALAVADALGISDALGTVLAVDGGGGRWPCRRSTTPPWTASRCGPSRHRSTPPSDSLDRGWPLVATIGCRLGDRPGHWGRARPSAS